MTTMPRDEHGFIKVACPTCGEQLFGVHEWSAGDPIAEAMTAELRALREENERLKAHRAEMPGDILEAERGVCPDDACVKCGGWGIRSYANTTTWHGGAGGQALTHDVCDRCWGSGHKEKRGADLRSIEAGLRTLTTERDTARRERDEAVAIADAALVGWKRGWLAPDCEEPAEVGELRARLAKLRAGTEGSGT